MNLRRTARGALAGALIATTACVQYIAPPTEPTVEERLLEAERLYADARDLYFQVYVTDATGTGRSVAGAALDDLRKTHVALRERALERLDAIAPAALSDDDRRARDDMLRTLRRELEENAAPGPLGPLCASDTSGDPGMATARLYACYGHRQSHVMVGADTLDRLTVLSRLASDTSSATRRTLWRSLEPVWQSVNGDNTPAGSPFRRLLEQRRSSFSRDGLPSETGAASLGVDRDRIEPMLLQVLDAWRATLPDTLVEPWNWYAANGEASRKLSPRIPLRELERVNEEFFSSFGASPRLLEVRYDLTPREGKTPVAFTQFGGVPQRTRTGPRGADPFVFATYREGGLGNLVELLHETGHAIHIAAIDTRPAWSDWPDSDPFTEALADVPAMEAYEGKWQLKYLGDSASTAASLREKYSGVMLDVAWALFELRLQRDPSLDPNRVWTELTQRYLGIAPHPEYSWWAMRGQLINSPGYMMNYALGAMLVADLRQRIAQAKGGFLTGGPKLYDWLGESLYEHGLSRTSRQVVTGFLGRAMTADALVRDLARLRASSGPAGGA